MCPTCGHCKPVEEQAGCSTAFPSEIIPNFLYLGSYDHASRPDLMRAMDITMILNTVPSAQNLYKNTFTYHTLGAAWAPTDIPGAHRAFHESIAFLEQARAQKQRVLVHCMTGVSKGPSVVIAYLMAQMGWALESSGQWVTERRRLVKLKPEILAQLQAWDAALGPRQPIPIAQQNNGPVGFPTFPELDKSILF